MTYLGFFVVYNSPFWTWEKKSNIGIPPVQIVGPIMLTIGLLLTLLGIICAVSTSQVRLYLIGNFYKFDLVFQ